MKLNFRDLKQQKFTIEAEPTETIFQVKEKIAAEKGWDATQQKLIYSGKILVDNRTVASYDIEEKGFIVCMVSKTKAPQLAQKTTTPSTPPASTSTPAVPAAPQPDPTSTAAADPPATPSPATTGVTTTTTTAATATSPGSASFNDPSALLVGPQGNEVIAQMESMGFARTLIDQAMRAAYFNPDRAVDYLLNGIPESVQAEQRQAAAARQNPPGAAGAEGQTAAGGAPAANPPPAAGGAGTATTTTEEPVNLFEAAAQAGGRGGAAGGTGAASGGRGTAAAGAGLAGAPANLDFLRSSPEFQRLRQLVQQQPQMLEPVLQQVAAGNPQLAEMITQNQEQFLQLLSEDLGDVPPGAVPISVTEEERDAIERLCRLGFPRDQVVQAYFACDKNEELAANFLFEQPDEEDG